MLTDYPELFDGMRLVPCAVMTDNTNPQAGWFFIPHVDGKWVSAAKLAPFSQQIINYWWNRPSSAEVRAEAPSPLDILDCLTDRPVSAGKAISSKCVRAEAQEPVGKFTVSQGKTINQIVYFETGLPDGEYNLYAAPQPPALCPKCAKYKQRLAEFDRVIDDLHCSVSCINPVTDLRNAIVALQAKVAEQAPFVEVGKAMVEITTTVRGPEEWGAIPELWLHCMKERDEALIKVSHQEMRIASLMQERKYAEDLAVQYRQEADQLRATVTIYEGDNTEWFCPTCEVVHPIQAKGLVQPCPACLKTMLPTSRNLREIDTLRKDVASLKERLKAIAKITE